MLRLVADGLPTKQIARSLSITERTVKFHVNSIFHKLGADNRAQAVALAAQRGPACNPPNLPTAARPPRAPGWPGGTGDGLPLLPGRGADLGSRVGAMLCVETTTAPDIQETET